MLDVRPVFLSDGGCLPIDVAVTLPPEDFPEIRLVSPVTLRGIITNTNGAVTLDAVWEAVYMAACARCLRETEYRLHMPVSRRLVVSASDEETENVAVSSNYLFDPEEFIRAELLLGLPMRHLCDENCPGLSPGAASL